MHSPVKQFTIEVLYELSLFGFDISFTNSALFMVLAVIVSTLFLAVAMRPAAVVPGRLQSAAEMMYEFVADMVRSNVGSEGRPYFPFIFTLFVFVLFSNLLGMLPYSYTTTSQIILWDGKKLHLIHEMKNKDGDIVATGEHMLLHVDQNKGASTMAHAPVSDGLAKLAKAHEALAIPDYSGRSVGVKK